MSEFNEVKYTLMRINFQTRGKQCLKMLIGKPFLFVQNVVLICFSGEKRQLIISLIYIMINLKASVISI